MADFIFKLLLSVRTRHRGLFAVIGGILLALNFIAHTIIVAPVGLTAQAMVLLSGLALLILQAPPEKKNHK